MSLNNAVVLITGAKGGLGTYVTKAFLAQGARVIGVSRSIKDADFPHDNFTAMTTELSSSAGAAELTNAVVAKFGRIDALVHVVGGFAGGHTVLETDDATIEHMLDLNFRSAFYLARAVLRVMRTQHAGRFLAVGSRAALEPSATLSAYSASKAALVSLIRTIALENRDSGVSANAVLPGTMDTPVNRAAMPGADFTKWVDPEQVAQLLVYLASPVASQINGAAIPVYGGEA
jgi:NAD(P)-dependent dehydrogenase (short-subunit alcohol dehydrogenase family)